MGDTRHFPQHSTTMIVLKKLYLGGIRLPILLGVILISVLQGKAQGLSASDSTRYISLIDSCFTAGNRGDYARAEVFLSEALRLNPPSALQPMLLNNLGGLQLLQGKEDAALLSFSSALSKDPHEATTRFNRAKLFVRRKEYKAALTDFALLISDHPKNELYRYQRAMLYLLTKEYDQAEGDLKSIIEHNEASLKARIGYALLETMRGNYPEAERIYAYLTDKLPKNAEVLEGRARMYLARGMKGFAQRDINQAFELLGGKAPATLYRLRAELNEGLGNRKAAAEDIQRAEALERSQP